MKTLATPPSDITTFKRLLAEAGSKVRNNSFTCVAGTHDDRNASGSIYEKPPGHARGKCHSCGWCGDVSDLRVLLTGRPLAEILREARGDGMAASSRPAPPPPRPKPSIDWEAIHAAGRKQLHPGELHDFSDVELGLSGEGVEALDPTLIDGRYAFPERDAEGNIIGLVRRTIEGRNLSAKGSSRGLTYRVPFPPDDPVLVVEGASDTAAAIEAGFNVVGRPSATGGGDLLAQLLRGRAVVVCGENDIKPDGRWPGREGAERIADRLRPVCKSVRILYPPENLKDIRAWLAGGGSA